MAPSERRRRLLFLSPVVPEDGGNGLAMRAGFFLQAYAREFDVDLAVFPILSAPTNSHDFARRRVGRMTIFPRPSVDFEFGFLASLSDPAVRLEAFRRFGRPSLGEFCWRDRAPVTG